MSLRDKMLAVIDDVNGSVAEREELVEMIAIALLTRKNLFVLGDPGQAKSYAINLFRQHITGARQFERLLSKQTDEEQLFGRVDLSSLIPGSIPDSVLEGDGVYQTLHFDLKCAVDDLGQMKNTQDTFAMLDRASDKLATYLKAVALLRPSEPVVQTVGKIPEADIVLLDEIFKCNDGVLNSLLTALNERKYTNEGHTYPIPTISFFAASNEIPNFNDPQEKILEALYDRLELKVVTANIEVLLNHCMRFYDRQFITRENVNRDVLTEFERLLDSYFEGDKPQEWGLPYVQYFADELHLSANYFGDLVKKETGKTPQEHIHIKLVDKAKELLCATNKSVSEIAYELGFKYPHHLSRMFKKNTGYSPSEFRLSA